MTQSMKPWGYLVTLLWAVLVFVIAQVAALGALYWWYGGDLRTVAAQPYGGVVVALVTLVANPIEIALLVGGAALARWDPVEYLGLVVPQSKQVNPAVLGLVALSAGSDAVIYLTNQAIVPPFEIEAFESARGRWLPALAIAQWWQRPWAKKSISWVSVRGWVRSARDARSQSR